MTATEKPLLGRSSMNAVTWLLLALAAVCVVLALAVPPQQLGEPGASVPVTLEADAADRASEPLEIPGLPDGLSVSHADQDLQLTAAELPAGLRLLSQTSAALVFLSVAGGAACLALVLRSIRAGRPFDRRNPGRLNGVALAIVVGGLLAPIVENVAANTVIGHLGLRDGDFPFALMVLDLRFNALLFAALVLAIGEAFRRGGALADDVDGLV